MKENTAHSTGMLYSMLGIPWDHGLGPCSRPPWLVGDTRTPCRARLCSGGVAASRLEPAPTLCSLFVFCHPNTTQHAPRHCFVYVQMRACVNGGSCVYTNTSTQVCMYLVCYVRCGNGFALQKTRELQIVAVLGDDTTGRRFPSLLLCVYPFLFFLFPFSYFYVLAVLFLWFFLCCCTNYIRETNVS